MPPENDERRPIEAADAQIIPPEGSINDPHGTTLRLPSQLEARLHLMERHIASVCVMACRGEGCTTQCALAVQT
jgi:hypothetical protein